MKILATTALVLLATASMILAAETPAEWRPAAETLDGSAPPFDEGTFDVANDAGKRGGIDRLMWSLGGRFGAGDDDSDDDRDDDHDDDRDDDRDDGRDDDRDDDRDGDDD